LARRDFTAEFGMGSGVGPLAMITRSSDRRRRQACDEVSSSRACRRKCLREDCAVGLVGEPSMPGEAADAALRQASGTSQAKGRVRDQADRAIRTGRLNALLRFHPRPINVVVFHGSHARPGFEGGFPLRCIQRLSRPHIATRRCRWRDNRYTRGASIPVLSY
jgi:hypothetical protein